MVEIHRILNKKMLGFVHRALILFSVGLNGASFGRVLAQPQCTITGRILDQETKRPVPLVNVILKNTRFGAATDSIGHFEIPGIPQDLYVIEFRHVAYKARMHVLQIGREEKITLDVELEQHPIQLEEITITGSKRQSERLQQTFASTVVTADQIKRSGATRLTDLIRSFEPGAVPFQARRRGERTPFLIYLDGAYVQYIPGSIDFIIDVNQIDRVEISRWVGAAPNFGPGTSDRVVYIHSKKRTY